MSKPLVNFLLAGIGLFLLCSGCLDPTQPTFRTEEGFYLVEGSIVFGGETTIRVRTSDFEDALLDFLPVTEATVVLTGPDDTRIPCLLTVPELGVYAPNEDFAPQPGEEYAVEVTFPDGNQAVSLAEEIPPRVVPTNLEIGFSREAFFDEGRDRFLPAHEPFLSYDDPADQTNYYAYDFTFWERTLICATCPQGLYRNGACTPPGNAFAIPTYDYLCDTEECYRVQRGRQTIYATDELTDGLAVNGLRLGHIELDEYGGLLVEGELRSITRAGYAYGRVLQDLTTGNGGLNATTPAALVGNVSNVSPTGREVLGFVGAVSRGAVRAFVERGEELGDLSRVPRRVVLEPDGPISPAPRATCDEPGRTSVRPAGWGG